MLNRFFRFKVNTEDIIPINAHTGHPIRERFLGYCFRMHLPVDRNGNRITIVLVEKYRWRLKYTGKVHAFMKVTFRCRPIPEVSDCNIVGSFLFLRPCSTYRVWELSGDGNRGRKNMFIFGRNTPLNTSIPIQKHPCHILPERQCWTMVPISRKQPVPFAQVKPRY